jgi:phospholipase/lecithinase/hemolysin
MRLPCGAMQRPSTAPGAAPAGVDDMSQLLFYTDSVHPSGQTGHRAIAEIAWHLLNETLG